MTTMSKKNITKKIFISNIKICIFVPIDFLLLLESMNKDSLVDPVFCPNDCGRSYKGKNRKYVLKRHVMYECLTPPQFPCPICTRLFKRKDEMLIHVQKKHNTFE